MADPIKHFPFWLNVAEFAALKRMIQTGHPAYPTSTLARDDRAHLTNVVQRLTNVFAGVPIGPAEDPHGVTDSPGVDLRSADPASKVRTLCDAVIRAGQAFRDEYDSPSGWGNLDEAETLAKEILNP